MENNKVMLRIAGSQQGEQQIATFANRVREIVPAYRLKIPEDETITIVKNAVKDSTYAPWSENNTMEGMYIQAHMINDGNSDKTEAGYADNQLVAIVDLNYRFLTPINPNVPVSPGTPNPNTIVSTTVDGDGCVIIDNDLQTITFDNTNVAKYYTILRVKPGFKRIPNGRLEMQIDHEQNGDNAWREVLSWENETEVEINCEDVVGNLRFVFEEECVYNLTIKRTLNGQPWPDCPIGETEVIEKHCSDVIDTDSEEIKKPITNYLINSVTPSEITTCTNTTIVVDYKPADSPLTLIWYDTTEQTALHTYNQLLVTSSESWDETRLNTERDNIYIPNSKEYEYKGIDYEESSSIPIEGDGSQKVVVFNYEKISYTVRYNVGDHVHMEDSSEQSTYYNGEVSEREYRIDEGFILNSNYTPEGAASVSIGNGKINVTNITDNITIYLGAASTVESIFASNMDAMGGVRLYAKYTDGTTEIINPAEATLNSYTVNSTTTNVSEQENVEVYDYSFIDNNKYTGEDKITTATKEIIKKKRVPLENPTTDDVENISLNVTYKGFNQDISGITQRAETYGYYEQGLNSDSDSSDLKTADAISRNWKTSYLVDFGDSCQMYGASDSLQGLDIYNKDITPYYIPGTDIGENPLLNITSSNVKYKKSNDSDIYDISNVKDNLNIDFNKPENDSSDYEHYHILWQEESKGRIFINDKLESTIEYCGLYDTTCGCTPLNKSKSSELYTLEAGQKSNSTNIKEIDKDPTVKYTVYYDIPSHNYGRDSISYYHTQLENYAAKVDENVFKDSNKQSLSFSYPIHISTYYYGSDVDHSSDTRYWSTTLTDPNYYKFNSVRWESSTSATVLTPDDNSYTQYYDYKNRIDVLGNYNNRALTTIDIQPYNKAYYEGGANFNVLNVGDSYNSSDKGREVTVYYTMMSPENQVRPTNPTENVYKFIKLNGVYNGADYSRDYNYGENLIELEDISNYTSEENKNNHVTYISSNYNKSDENNENETPDIYEPLNIELKYLYNKHDSVITKIGKNKDYSYKYEGGYSSINEPITEDPENGIYYPYRLYNLSTGIQIRQFYNNNYQDETDRNITNHYLHNSDNTKYVACAEGFKGVNYNIYYPKELTSNYDIYEWWINNLPNVTMITSTGHYESGHYVYKVDVTVDGNTTTYDCYNTGSRNTVNGDYLDSFCELTYTTVPIYTNADSITVEFLGGCPKSIEDAEKDTCGIGSFKIEVNGEEDQSEAWTSANSAKIKNLSGNSTIRIIANTRTPELITAMDSASDRRNYILNNYDYYRNNMFTGGGRFKVTTNWTNGDKRILIIDISGTCNHHKNNNPDNPAKDNNPNKEGCMISWLDLMKYYKLSGSENTRYDNTNTDYKLEWIGPESSNVSTI